MTDPLPVGGLSGCEGARKTRAAGCGPRICRRCGGTGMREVRADGRRVRRAHLFRFVEFCGRGGRRQAVNLVMIENRRRSATAAGKIGVFTLNTDNASKAKIKQLRFSEPKKWNRCHDIFIYSTSTTPMNYSIP
ncbi:hypothetical protein [Burkholderia lata]|uniref:hypothetical protein n=1 Tax=Burkholderia lata (strain ATCC 17760 / DSM 23089 / LMG 22485 / NCIMB 9086 / R18194 / 383) TaxID=482957 RepID=UPI00399B58F0